MLFGFILSCYPSFSKPPPSPPMLSLIERFNDSSFVPKLPHIYDVVGQFHESNTSVFVLRLHKSEHFSKQFRLIRTLPHIVYMNQHWESVRERSLISWLVLKSTDNTTKRVTWCDFNIVSPLIFHTSVCTVCIYSVNRETNSSKTSLAQVKFVIYGLGGLWD